jgi:hypothetical protein
MDVRFSRHAVQRLRERFRGDIDQLIAVVVRGIFEKGAEPAPAARWAVVGLIKGKPVKVVFVEEVIGEFRIVTAMWL